MIIQEKASRRCRDTRSKLIDNVCLKSLPESLCKEAFAVELTRLALNLVAGPASSVLSAGREVLLSTSVTGHRGEPIGTEVVGELAVGESLGDVTVRKC